MFPGRLSSVCATHQDALQSQVHGCGPGSCSVLGQQHLAGRLPLAHPTVGDRCVIQHLQTDRSEEDVLRVRRLAARPWSRPAGRLRQPHQWDSVSRQVCAGELGRCCSTLTEGATMRHLFCLPSRPSHLPGVEYEAEPQLPVVDHRVAPHVLLGPDAVGQSLLQPADADQAQLSTARDGGRSSRSYLFICISTAALWKKPTARCLSLARVRSNAWTVHTADSRSGPPQSTQGDKQRREPPPSRWDH